MNSYKHHDLGKDVKTISGYYTYLEENRLRYKDRDVIYVVGIGVIDNSCCGAGGCRFIDVPGYVISWKSEMDETENYISKVEEIAQEDQKEIHAILDKLYPYSQINFV